MDNPIDDFEAGRIRATVKWLTGALWYGLLALVGLWILQRPVLDAVRRTDGFRDLRGILTLIAWLLVLAMLAAFFHLVAALVRWNRALPWIEPTAAAVEPVASSATRTAFPAPVTLVAGGCLVIATITSLIALLVVLANPPWLSDLIGPSNWTDFEDLLVTMFAGAVGGSVSAVVAYLKHASEVKDFDPAYLPWYAARPVIGLLLGMIGFFLIKGGLLATLPEVSGQDFNNFGIAAMGALIGLFSKNAIEKLREVFHTVFASRADVLDEVLQRLQKALSPEQWARVTEALRSTQQPPAPSGDVRETKEGS